MKIEEKIQTYEGTKMKIEEKIQTYLLSEKSQFDKMMDAITSNWNRKIKRKKLKKLGYSDSEIDFIESQYRDVIKKYTKSKDPKHNWSEIPSNFGGIGKYAHISSTELNKALRDRFKKTYRWE